MGLKKAKSRIVFILFSLSLVLVAGIATILVVNNNATGVPEVIRSVSGPVTPPVSATDAVIQPDITGTSAQVTLTLPTSYDQPVTSQFPTNTPQPFVYPPPTPADIHPLIDPKDVLEKLDRDAIPGLTADAASITPGHGHTLWQGITWPQLDMNLRPGKPKDAPGQPYSALWLPNSQPYRGVYSFQLFFPTQFDPIQDHSVVALLDSRPIKLKREGGELADRLDFQLKSGEKTVFNIETEPLPLGVHNLAILTFDMVHNNNPVFVEQMRSSSGAFQPHSYKVFVGTNKDEQSYQFADWSVGPNLFPRLENSMGIIDLQGSITNKAFAPWMPGSLQPGQQLDYTVGITGLGEADREYCLVAYLDYKPIPIQPGKEPTCGIVKGGQWGIVKGSLKVPDEPGVHRLQVVRIENPLMKGTYMQSRPSEEISHYSASGRILLDVQAAGK